MGNRFTTHEAKMGRVIFGRLYPGTDLIGGLLDLCRGEGIRYGFIPTIIGSLAKASFIYAVPDSQAILKISYSQPVEIQGPLEFIGGQGIIGVSGSGSAMIHFHGVVSDKDRKVHSGHFIEGGNPILATMEVVIQELNQIRLVKSLDNETGFPLFKSYGKEDQEY